jgi:hypothetical protein
MKQTQNQFEKKMRPEMFCYFLFLCNGHRVSSLRSRGRPYIPLNCVEKKSQRPIEKYASPSPLCNMNRPPSSSPAIDRQVGIYKINSKHEIEMITQLGIIQECQHSDGFDRKTPYNPADMDTQSNYRQSTDIPSILYVLASTHGE